MKHEYWCHAVTGCSTPGHCTCGADTADMLRCPERLQGYRCTLPAGHTEAHKVMMISTSADDGDGVPLPPDLARVVGTALEGIDDEHRAVARDRRRLRRAMLLCAVCAVVNLALALVNLGRMIGAN